MYEKLAVFYVIFNFIWFLFSCCRDLHFIDRTADIDAAIKNRNEWMQESQTAESELAKLQNHLAQVEIENQTLKTKSEALTQAYQQILAHLDSKT